MVNQASTPSVTPQEVSSQQQVAGISLQVRIPPFWRDKPQLWFISFEAATRDLNRSEDQLAQMVIAQLDKQDIEQIADLLFKPSAEQYTAIKTRLITAYEESDSKQFQKLLSEMELVVIPCCKSFVRRYAISDVRQASSFVPKEYSGQSYETIDKLKADHLPPALPNNYKRPLLLHQGHMQWLYDHENNKYLDLFAGIVTVSVGHCHPKVVGALQKQINTLWHTTSIYRHPGMYEYIEKLVSKFPGDLKVVYLVNSGTEANDLAVLLAKAYTGNNDVISLQSSYHGYSTGIMGLTASQGYRMPVPVPPGFYHAPLPDPFRGYWGGQRDSISQVPGAPSSSDDDCDSSDKYIHQLNEVLETSIPAGRLAAMFAESIQGVNGTVQFPKGYLKKARQLVKKHGGLFVSDEVQSGFGRTGDHFWGFEGHGIIPDIVTMAKGIGNGFPMAAVVTTREIAAAHAKAAYFNTFGGNPLASAVGKAVLEVIEEEELQKNCKEVGKYFIEQLQQLQKVHPVIGDVRGKGLMLGVELVVPGTKEPLPAADVVEVMEIAKDNGVLYGRGGRYSNVLRIKPPMCINKDNVDYGVHVLDKAIKQALNKKPK